MTEVSEQAVPAAALQTWLRDNVAGASGAVRVEQLSGGSSNLTFRVRDDANDWVLRRPPLGRVLATANDVAREHRVQHALHDTAVPVPRMAALCVDGSVIGAPFYLMDRLDGIVYADADSVAHLDESQSRFAAYELVDVLARLHAVDAERVGLGDLGKPAGFAARQVARWRTQWEKSKIEDLPVVEEVARRLESATPRHERHGIVHGDYSFNNTMWHRDDPTRMQAVLDWEMSTLGDPRTDLGMVLVYWGEVGAVLWRNRSGQPHHANSGFPTADELVERYAATSGADVDDLDFFRVLATFKLAIICQGSAARTAAAHPEQATETVRLVERLAGMALEDAGRLRS